MKCGKANAKTSLPGHEVVVGLRCGKTNTKTPRSLAKLDPVFTCDNSGCSIFLSHEGGVVEASYLVPLLQEASQKGSFSGGTYVDPYPSPDHEDAYRV